MGITDTLNSVSGALAGEKQPDAAPPATLTFYKGVPIGLPEGSEAQSAQPNGGNTRDTAYPTEFIHFGYVHPDYSSRYEGQAKEKDDVAWDASNETGLHGTMQRAALQREALLLAGFVTALQKTLEERQKGKGKGGLGSLVGAAADILGGQGGKATEPTPEDCNPFGQALKTAADKVKGPKVAYKDMHQAGIDLRQARLNYAQYLKKLRENPPKDQGPAGLLSGVSAISSALPGGLGTAVTIVQGIAFKPFDVYLGIFTGIAEALEPKVMAACHDLSIDAIKQYFTPLFAPWYQAPPGAQDPGCALSRDEHGREPHRLGDTSGRRCVQGCTRFPGRYEGRRESLRGLSRQGFRDAGSASAKRGRTEKARQVSRRPHHQLVQQGAWRSSPAWAARDTDL